MNTVSIPQQEIIVDVSFYDDAERQKLLEYLSAANMQQIVSSSIAIPTPEFRQKRDKRIKGVGDK